MKKILISCTYFLPNISGVTIYVDILTKELVKSGHKVSVLTSKYLDSLKGEEVINDIQIYRSKKLVSINKGVFLPFFWLDSLKLVLKNDVIFANLPQVESIFLAIWSRIFSKKFVIIHHCEFNFSGSFSNKLISLLTYPVHLVSYILADKIISYTKDYADTSIFLRYFKNKLVYILPPVVIGKENKNKQKEILKKIKVLKNEKVVGFVGRIAWEKGINYLIEAVKNIDNTKLVLVGPFKELVGDNSYQNLKGLIDENKDKVIVWGPVNHDELVDFYKVFDCLVLPSINNLETFGIVQIEAMAQGCPVVASNLPGVRVPVNLTRLGEIVEKKNSFVLEEKIKTVLATNYKKEMFDRAKDIFSMNSFVDNYNDLISSM